MEAFPGRYRAAVLSIPPGKSLLTGFAGHATEASPVQTTQEDTMQLTDDRELMSRRAEDLCWRVGVMLLSARGERAIKLDEMLTAELIDALCDQE